jgi:hypothetical protein
MGITMPKMKHLHIKARQQEKGLTDRALCEILGCTLPWWRGFLAAQYPASLKTALALSALLDLPLAEIWWRESVEHRPEAA